MIDKPIFFERNRVGRVYTGGKLFSGFFGDEPIDNFLPEEWIASSVKAINKNPISEKEGVSKVLNSDVYFDDLLKKYPSEMLGKSGKMRILVKVLDSSVRLPAQAHPDKEYSKKYFNSEFGKTECWIILDTRENAKLYFGFKEGVNKDIFSKAIDANVNDKSSMENLMLNLTPKKSDVYLVPAKTVHAIGAGCLILEIQEPTDFTIQPEHWCGDYELNSKEMYLGLTKEQAIECFDFAKAPDTKLVPKATKKSDTVKLENLAGPENTPCFVINRITLSGGGKKLNVNDSYGVYIITDGFGVIKGDNYEKKVSKGDYFFMPALLMNKFTICGNLECIECF